MMIVDASVFVAIYKGEPGASAFEPIVAGGRFVLASTTLTEVGMRVRTYTGSADKMRSYVSTLQARAVETVPIDAALATVANDAFGRYGKGTGHPAKLNFGDCLVYAVARRRGLPLLFKGDDFGHTDLVLHPGSQDKEGGTLQL